MNIFEAATEMKKQGKKFIAQESTKDRTKYEPTNMPECVVVHHNWVDLNKTDYTIEDFNIADLPLTQSKYNRWQPQLKDLLSEDWVVL